MQQGTTFRRKPLVRVRRVLLTFLHLLALCSRERRLGGSLLSESDGCCLLFFTCGVIQQGTTFRRKPLVRVRRVLLTFLHLLALCSRERRLGGSLLSESDGCCSLLFTCWRYAAGNDV
ncbi:hypothetical protein RRG08_039122 [Elysia crispata]|uniref:Secreted protein n=1 Tax=Elysia crispata TaxID=231223 RepID=A0AAE1A789_9GAST|nr:hypothetical protein RRG08_039122 [Elysia crispata]